MQHELGGGKHEKKTTDAWHGALPCLYNDADWHGSSLRVRRYAGQCSAYGYV